MSTERLYLDYNASAMMRMAVLAELDRLCRYPGNASSPHQEGRRHRAEIEKARATLCALCQGEEAYFTSGGTEANNLALRGSEEFFISAIEHPSILRAIPEKHNSVPPIQSTHIPVTALGVIDLDALEACLKKSTARRKLVSVMFANNETGVIQPVGDVGQLCQKYGALFHCDAVQAFGKTPINMKKLSIDMLSVSSHKLGGTQGVGALILARDIPLTPLMGGGGQERYMRPGTENTASIAAFGLAATLAQEEIAGWTKKNQWRIEYEKKLQEIAPNAIIHGKDAEHRLPNTICISFPAMDAALQVIHFDRLGIAIGAGSACSSGRVAPSHVLKAMGLSEIVARTAIRISWGIETKRQEMERFLEAWHSLTNAVPH